MESFACFIENILLDTFQYIKTYKNQMEMYSLYDARCCNMNPYDIEPLYDHWTPKTGLRDV